MEERERKRGREKKREKKREKREKPFPAAKVTLPTAREVPRDELSSPY